MEKGVWYKVRVRAIYDADPSWSGPWWSDPVSRRELKFVYVLDDPVAMLQRGRP